MSHNPNEIKSQHEMDNQGMRSSDVLLEAISKAERLQKQLDIAVKALEIYKNFIYDGTLKNYESLAKQTLAEIKEMDND